MGSLYDVGVKFQFAGGQQAKSQMDGLHGSFRRLSTTVDQGAAGITSAFSRMAGGIGRAAGIGTAGITGLIAAAALLPYKLAATREELSRAQNNLRSVSLTEDEIRDLEEHTVKFTNRWAGFTSEAFTHAFYEIQGTLGDLAMEQKKAITDISVLGGKTVGMNPNEATDYFTNMWGALKYQKLYKDMDPTKFAEMIMAQTQKAVEIFKAKGPELARSISEAAPILGRQGWNFEQMLGTAGVLKDAGFKPEVVGTAMRNIGLREREGLAKIMSQSVVGQITGKDDAWEQLKATEHKKIEGFMTKLIDESNVLNDKAATTLPCTERIRPG